MARIAAAQFTGHREKEVNVEKGIQMVRQAAGNGASFICLPELFNTMYFCYEENYDFLDFAEPIPGPTIDRMAQVAKETRTVVVAPVFEKAMKGEYYNAAVLLGPGGEILGKYRKSSIPLPYRNPQERSNEKFFFKPGNLGFPVFSTPFGVNVGIMICYDRHFPEAARVLALRGAEVVFVPTATCGYTRYMWELELRAHAAMNIYYVCGVNKVGVDVGGSPRDHWGTSMIVDPRGQVMAQASDREEGIVYADIDLNLIEELRRQWGFYRDRRPDLYGPLVE